jgi:lipopolysaccharide export system protein LptA
MRLALSQALCLAAWLASGPALAQAGAPAGSSPPAAARKDKDRGALGALGGSGKEPIKIDADRLDVFDHENKAVFAGNVVAVQGDSTIRCSTMTVHYQRKDGGKDGAKEAKAESKPADAASADAIRQVDCAGPVTVVSKDQVATGDNAVFDRVANRVVLTGNVVLSQCQNVTRGSRLVYDLNAGRANMDPQAGGRVSAMFVPGGKDEGAGKGGCAAPAQAGKPAAKPRAQAN